VTAPQLSSCALGLGWRHSFRHPLAAFQRFRRTLAAFGRGAKCLMLRRTMRKAVRGLPTELPPRSATMAPGWRRSVWLLGQSANCRGQRPVVGCATAKPCAYTAYLTFRRGLARWDVRSQQGEPMPTAKNVIQRPLGRDQMLKLRQPVDFGGALAITFGILVLIGVVMWWGLLPLAQLIAVAGLASCVFFTVFWALFASYKPPTRSTQARLRLLREACSAANAYLSNIENQGRSLTNWEARALLRKHGRLHEASLAGCGTIAQ
jgi:hypothetical protein